MIILYLSSSNKLLKEGMGQMPDARDSAIGTNLDITGERVADVGLMCRRPVSTICPTVKAKSTACVCGKQAIFLANSRRPSVSTFLQSNGRRHAEP